MTLARVALCAVGFGGLTACGDGGSSGFDVSAAQVEEQRVIVEVVQSVECMELNGILICGTPMMPGSNTMSPELSDPVRLSPPSGEPVPCIGDATAGCTATIGITGGQLPGSNEGFSTGSTLLVAVGPVDPPMGWLRGEAVVYAVGSHAQADLHVTLPPGGALPLLTGTRVRVAVLAYPPGVHVPGGPPAVDLLSDFGAGAAVVANDLVLQLSAGAP